jgi:hypothetical protein
MTAAHILAATLTIAFQGLMLFQGNSGGMEKSKHVAIVDDLYGDHKKPYVEIWSSGDADGELISIGRYALAPTDLVEFDFSPGIVSPTKLYRRHVPKIEPFILGDHHVHDDVHEQTLPHNAVLLFVSLPGGTLTTYQTFEERVAIKKKNFGKKRKCFARFVVLQTSPSPTKIKIHHDGQDYNHDLLPDDLVVFSNAAPPQPPNTEPYSHFHLYEGLLNGSGKRLGDATILDSDPCKEPDMVGTKQFTDRIKAVLDDIAKTRTPNGDCGPIDNPGSKP